MGGVWEGRRGIVIYGINPFLQIQEPKIRKHGFVGTGAFAIIEWLKTIIFLFSFLILTF